MYLILLPHKLKAAEHCSLQEESPSNIFVILGLSEHNKQENSSEWSRVPVLACEKSATAPTSRFLSKIDFQQMQICSFTPL